MQKCERQCSKETSIQWSSIMSEDENYLRTFKKYCVPNLLSWNLEVSAALFLKGDECVYTHAHFIHE